MPVDFVEVTSVLDFTSGQPADLIWRGVYRDSEKTAARFSDTLPKDFEKLLDEFPPKKKA
jgi:hypothetical protein